MDRQPSLPLDNYAFLLGGNTYSVGGSYVRGLRPPAVRRCRRLVVGMVYWDMYMSIDQTPLRHHLAVSTYIIIYIL